MVPGVVVFCSVVVQGIEWCVLCAGGCGIVDPRSVEETLQRGGQVPQHAGQSITSPLRASSPQGLANSCTRTDRHTRTLPAQALCHPPCTVSDSQTATNTRTRTKRQYLKTSFSSVTRKSQKGLYQVGSKQHLKVPTMGHDSAHVSGTLFKVSPLNELHAFNASCFLANFRQRSLETVLCRCMKMCYILSPNIYCLHCY